jgi:site-specific recombinase XerD
MRLYDRNSQRLYLNTSERTRFLEAANDQPAHIQAFCLTLLYTGCRLSEARELTIHSLQADERLISIRSLKKRNQHHIREIPVPIVLCQSLIAQAKKVENPEHTSQNNLLWQSAVGGTVDRVTAYRWVKPVMNEADIYGPQACPKGLRHSYGINAIRCGVQINMLQKWMGHASMETTAIYTNAVGKEELEIADMMW